MRCKDAASCLKGVELMIKASHIHSVINTKSLGFPLFLLILPILYTAYLTEEYLLSCLFHVTGPDREHEFSTYYWIKKWMNKKNQCLFVSRTKYWKEISILNQVISKHKDWDAKIQKESSQPKTRSSTKQHVEKKL